MIKEFSREQLVEVMEKPLHELKLKYKLFAITRDNASNNSTLCYHLFQRLFERYDNKPSLVG